MKRWKGSILLVGLCLFPALALAASPAQPQGPAENPADLPSADGYGICRVVAPVANTGEELACAATAQDEDSATALGLPIDDLADRLAICRLMPECWANADCDAQCGGAGLGRCAHSRCPVRVCRCK